MNYKQKDKGEIKTQSDMKSKCKTIGSHLYNLRKGVMSTKQSEMSDFSRQEKLSSFRYTIV